MEMRLFCRFLSRINGSLPVLDESGRGCAEPDPFTPLPGGSRPNSPENASLLRRPREGVHGLAIGKAPPPTRNRPFEVRRHAAACRPDWRDPPPSEVAAPKSG